MKPENFNNFTKEHLGKDVIATVKDPKRVIKGILINDKGDFFIKNGETTRIGHANIKTISVVLTKSELKRRKQTKFLMN